MFFILNKLIIPKFNKTLKKIGFYPFQKSVMVHPFECRDEMDFVIEFFNLRPYVRTMLANNIDNELARYS